MVYTRIKALIPKLKGQLWILNSLIGLIIDILLDHSTLIQNYNLSVTWLNLNDIFQLKLYCPYIQPSWIIKKRAHAIYTTVTNAISTHTIKVQMTFHDLPIPHPCVQSLKPSLTITK